MRRFLISLAFGLLWVASCGATTVVLTTGGRTATATLADNAATRELVALLEKGPVTVTMSDYGGFEKVGALPQSFTTDDSRITTVAGDIMLYQGNNIVVFYGSNTWAYTPLGKIDGATAESVRAFLGNGQITLTITLPSTTSVAGIEVETPSAEDVYDLHGRKIVTRPLPAGFYIINGRKTLLGVE